MKLVKAVNSQDVTLTGVKVDFQVVDGKIEAVVVTDASGRFIRIVKDGTYSDHLKVLVEEPVEYTTIYKLTVKIDDGVSVYKLDSKEKLEHKIQSLYLEEGQYSVEEIQVEVEKNLLGQTLAVDTDSIPF